MYSELKTRERFPFSSLSSLTLSNTIMMKACRVRWKTALASDHAEVWQRMLHDAITFPFTFTFILRSKPAYSEASIIQAV